MADLQFIKALHNEYKSESKFSKVDFNKSNLNEALDPNKIEKALNSAVAELGPEYVMYFEEGVKADIVILFIDICSFSTKYEGFSDNDLVTFLDNYYQTVLPIIYKHGGEVDKIIGDGIVCVFGPPFSTSSLQNNINNSFQCCKELILKTRNTGFESKIALHAGEIRYYKNSSVEYLEYTIIGKIITEIFRLESIAHNAAINFYSGSKIDIFFSEILEERKRKGINSRAEWTVSTDIPIIPLLKGVSYNHYQTITYNE